MVGSADCVLTFSTLYANYRQITLSWPLPAIKYKLQLFCGGNFTFVWWCSTFHLGDGKNMVLFCFSYSLRVMLVNFHHGSIWNIVNNQILNRFLVKVIPCFCKFFVCVKYQNVLRLNSLPWPSYYPRTEIQEDLQKLPPGFPRGAVPQPPFPPLAPIMGQMHTLMPAQSLQPTQQLEYKVRLVV